MNKGLTMKCLLLHISRLPVIAAALAVTATPSLACEDHERVIILTTDADIPPGSEVS